MVQSKENTAKALFGIKFHCRVPQSATVSVDYLKIFGGYTTGDQTADRAIASQLTDVMLTIPEIIRYAEEGVETRLFNAKDFPIMHQVIEAHLKSWEYALSTMANVGKVPEDDLKRLKDFSDFIAPMAEFAGANSNAPSTYSFGRFRRTSRRDSINLLDMLRRGVIAKAEGVNINHVPTTIKPQESLRDIYQRHARLKAGLPEEPVTQKADVFIPPERY